MTTIQAREKICFSEALKKAALNQDAKHYLLNNPTLFKMLLKGARRYIGGETLDEALETREKIQREGLLTSLEFMGENVKTLKEASEATHEFLKIINHLKKDNKPTRVSFDLSHLGLFLDENVGLNNLKQLAESTKGSLIDLFISAEGLNQTDAILKAYFDATKKYSNIGITIQAYLHRSLKDLDQVLQQSEGKIRLVKGAYSGNPSEFLPRGIELNKRYLEMVEKIFKEKRYCSIATHDEEVINHVLPLIHKNQIDPLKYEFEMLFGIGTDTLDVLKKNGHPCRKYIVYGKEWYLYFCNRLAENPDNIYSVIRDIIE